MLPNMFGEVGLLTAEIPKEGRHKVRVFVAVDGVPDYAVYPRGDK